MSLTEQEPDELRAASADVKEATPRILRAVCEALGWEPGLVRVLDRERGSLRFVEAWSADASEAGEFSRKASTSPSNI